MIMSINIPHNVSTICLRTEHRANTSQTKTSEQQRTLTMRCVDYSRVEIIVQTTHFIRRIGYRQLASTCKRLLARAYL